MVIFRHAKGRHNLLSLQIWSDTIFDCVFFKDMVKQTKAKTFQAYLDSCHRRYSCVHCRAHLANHDDLISKVRVPLCDFCGTFTARFVNCNAVCIKDSRVCLFSVISRQSRTCLPVQFCVSFTSGKKISELESHCDWRNSWLNSLWFQGECGLWPSRRKAAADRSSCCGWYLLRELPHHTGLEICKHALF